MGCCCTTQCAPVPPLTTEVVQEVERVLSFEPIDEEGVKVEDDDLGFEGYHPQSCAWALPSCEDIFPRHCDFSGTDIADIELFHIAH